MHIPVLLNEAINLLDPGPGELFIDGTFGSGGHAQEILKRIGPNGTLLAIDWDRENIKRGQEKFKAKNTIFINDNFAELPRILSSQKLPKADGLLLDLGFSSEQLEKSGRGFSFQREEPLLMTYAESQTSVTEILARISEKDLAEIIRKFGEERFAGPIAAAIVRQRQLRPIKTSRQLAEIVRSAVSKNYEHGRINPATRTFQALRIYANRELENLESVLMNLTQILKSEGRIAIISFHSLEDRLVKSHFRNLAKEGRLKILTKKPIIAGQDEIQSNPRSRSAKLRAAQLI